MPSEEIPCPSVSVLVAARDPGPLLASALASVARQSLADWECVVVDDGSTVPIEVPTDPRFRLLRSSGDGVASARNHGLQRCRGEHVAVLDADDLMRRRRLELQLSALRDHPTWVGVGSWVRYFPRHRVGEGMRAYEAWLNSLRTPEDLRRNAWIEMPVGHPTLMLRRSALLEAGGWRDMGWPEDWDLFLRLVFEKGGRVGLLEKRLLAWRRQAGSLSRSGGSFSIEAFQRCRAHHLAQHFLQGAAEYTLWGYGQTGRLLRRELDTYGKHPTHVVEVHPRRLGNRLRGALAIPPEALAELRPARIVVSVAGAQPRGLIRDFLDGLGFAEGTDYVLAA